MQAKTRKLRERIRDGVIFFFALVSLGLAFVAAKPEKFVIFLPNHHPKVITGKNSTWVGSYLSALHADHNNDHAKAADYLGIALFATPQNGAIQSQALTLMLIAGKFDKAFLIADLISHQPTPSATARLTLAIREIANNNFAAASGLMGNVENQGFDEIVNSIILAWCETGTGNFEKSRGTLSKIETGKTFHLLINYHLALMAETSGNLQAAEEIYDLLLKDEKTGNLPTIIAAAIRNKELLGKNEEAKKLLATYAISPEKQETIAKSKRGENFTPKQGIAQILFDAASIMAAEYSLSDKAAAFLRIALYIDPKKDEAKLILSQILGNEKDYAAASALLSSVPSDSSLALQSKLAYARNFDLMGESDKAKTYLQEIASGNDDGKIEALISLADLYRRKTEYKESAEFYTKAIDALDKKFTGKFPEKYWVLYYARGIAYERSHKWDAAEKDFLKALELKPNQPDVLNYLGYSWVTQDTNLEKALEMLEKALSVRPNDPHIEDSVGYAWFKLGKLDKAAEYLEQAAEDMPYDATVNDHLGDVYWKQGRKMEARYMWKRALDSNPEEGDIEAIRKKLEHGSQNTTTEEDKKTSIN